MLGSVEELVGKAVLTSYSTGPYLVVRVNGPTETQYDGSLGHEVPSEANWHLAVHEWRDASKKPRQYVINSVVLRDGKLVTLCGDQIAVIDAATADGLMRREGEFWSDRKARIDAAYQRAVEAA